jgi:hypothetical protein
MPWRQGFGRRIGERHHRVSTTRAVIPRLLEVECKTIMRLCGRCSVNMLRGSAGSRCGGERDVLGCEGANAFNPFA